METILKGIVFQADKRVQIIIALNIGYYLALRRPKVKTFEDTEMHVTKKTIDLETILEGIVFQAD